MSKVKSIITSLRARSQPSISSDYSSTSPTPLLLPTAHGAKMSVAPFATQRAVLPDRILSRIVEIYVDDFLRDKERGVYRVRGRVIDKPRRIIPLLITSQLFEFLTIMHLYRKPIFHNVDQYLDFLKTSHPTSFRHVESMTFRPGACMRYGFSGRDVREEAQAVKDLQLRVTKYERAEGRGGKNAKGCLPTGVEMVFEGEEALIPMSAYLFQASELEFPVVKKVPYGTEPFGNHHVIPYAYIRLEDLQLTTIASSELPSISLIHFVLALDPSLFLDRHRFSIKLQRFRDVVMRLCERGTQVEIIVERDRHAFCPGRDAKEMGLPVHPMRLELITCGDGECYRRVGRSKQGRLCESSGAAIPY